MHDDVGQVRRDSVYRHILITTEGYGLAGKGVTLVDTDVPVLVIR
jgi:hypothetical protein